MSKSSNSKSENPRLHPMSAVSGRMTAQEFNVLMGRKKGTRRPGRRKAQPVERLLEVKGEVSELPLKFALPFVPPSVNALFHSVRDEETGRPKRVLTRKARNMRKAIGHFVHGRLPDDEIYELHVIIELPALTKQGKLRKVDLTNRIKFLEDCIASRLGIDDRQFFRVVLDKVHASHERTRIEIHPYQSNRNIRAA